MFFSQKSKKNTMLNYSIFINKYGYLYFFLIIIIYIYALYYKNISAIYLLSVLFSLQMMSVLHNGWLIKSLIYKKMNIIDVTKNADHPQYEIHIQWTIPYTSFKPWITCLWNKKTYKIHYTTDNELEAVIPLEKEWGLYEIESVQLKTSWPLGISTSIKDTKINTYVYCFPSFFPQKKYVTSNKIQKNILTDIQGLEEILPHEIHKKIAWKESLKKQKKMGYLFDSQLNYIKFNADILKNKSDIENLYLEIQSLLPETSHIEVKWNKKQIFIRNQHDLQTLTKQIMDKILLPEKI